MKLSEMRQTLAAAGIQLTKSLGQNFLHDANQLVRIAEAAELAKSDRVLEIGPGLGPLTQLLVQRAAHVLAIEMDQRLVEMLKGAFAGTRNLTILHADALEYLRETTRDWSGWKMVSNLPYSVASPILVELARRPQPAERLVVTLQLEVGQRLTSLPGTSDYGVLTLLIQLTYEPRGIFKIPADCFFPVPEVDSACVTLVRRKQPRLLHKDRPLFEKIVKRAFSQRRKMMLKLLKADWPTSRLQYAFGMMSLSPEVRAEKVSLDQFARLTQLLGTNENGNPAHE